ncbi:MAG TPA: hypothetical protein VJZ17_04835 [Nitrosopumilaceae archaeon]|jgi:excinuclease UvrABC nuclease subunit|nr:hypothetical protein [Nitrosopumilaceae archaeon]
MKITWSNRIPVQNTNIKDIPERPGVYEIQGRKKADGGYTRRYVGMAENLKHVYSEHLSDNEPNEKLKNFLKEKKAFFRYVTSDAEHTRKDLEKGLYFKHKHSFNTLDNPPAGSGKYLKIKIEESNA